LTSLLGRLGERILDGIHGATAQQGLFRLDRQTFRLQDVQNFDRLGDDLLANAVTRQHRDFHDFVP
jgi:hypothetical protein